MARRRRTSRGSRRHEQLQRRVRSGRTRGLSDGFNVTCSPGKDAAAGYIRVTEHLPALVIYLDLVNMAIQLPPFPGGDLVLARFCRELAREATKLAAEIDPEGGTGKSEAAEVRVGVVADAAGGPTRMAGGRVMTTERWMPPGVDIEPCDELELLDQLPPGPEDSARVWLAWHERHVAVAGGARAGRVREAVRAGQAHLAVAASGRDADHGAGLPGRL